MATEVPVTPSQVRAAKRIVERDSANGRETSEAIRKIAEATVEPLPDEPEPPVLRRLTESPSQKNRDTSSRAKRKFGRRGQRTTRITQKTNHPDTHPRTTRQVTGKVLWSAQAEADLEDIAPAIRRQLRRNAEETLPDIRPGCTGNAQGIFWHRGITHRQETEVDSAPEEDVDGIQPWDYYLFYRKLDDPNGFEVLAVLSTHQIANQIANLAGDAPSEPLSDANDVDQWLMEMTPETVAEIVGRGHGSL
jgi:plasmid stabilization system protein ParE